MYGGRIDVRCEVEDLLSARQILRLCVTSTERTVVQKKKSTALSGKSAARYRS